MNLIDAAGAGNVARVRELLAVGAEVNARDGQGSTALIAACSDAKWEVARLLLAAGADANAQTPQCQTAIQAAAGCGDRDMIRELLKAGANPEIATQTGILRGPALHWAAAQGKTAAVRALLEGDAHVDTADDAGNTALMKAAQVGYAETVQVLLDAGAGLNLRNHRGVTALFAAAARGRGPMVELLLRAGADVNLPTDQGFSPLLAAVSQGHAKVARRLIAAGADVNAANAQGKTALFEAVYQSKGDSVRNLLRAGANPNVACREYDAFDADLVKGTTPLMLAVAKRRAGAFVALLKAGADLEARNDRDETALAIAAAKGLTGYVDRLRAAGARGGFDEAAYRTRALIPAVLDGDADRVQALLQAGADPNVRNVDVCHHGKTPLIHAAETGRLEIARLLLAAGADVHAAETSTDFVGNGRTAAHYAAASGSADILAALQKAGADLGVRDRQGYSPLMLAAFEGHIEAVRFLAAAGVDLDSRDRKHGNSALTMAASAGHVAVLQALAEAGAARDPNALIAAATACLPEAVHILLEIGIPANGREEKEPGRTALIAANEVQALLTVPARKKSLGDEDHAPWRKAVRSRQNAILRTLLAAGADVRARDRLGRTALLAASGRNNHVTVKTNPDRDTTVHFQIETVPLSTLGLLLDAGAEVDGADNDGNTPLTKLADIDTRFCPPPVKAMSLLLSRGASLEARNVNGETALFVAAARGSIRVLTLLLGHGAEVNATAADGRTALFRAVESGRAGSVRVLLEAEAGVNAADGEGKTPLLAAVEARDEDLVRLLLGAGADVAAKDASGHTPLNWAIDQGADDLADLLRQAGAEVTGRAHRELREAVEAGDRELVKALLAKGADCHWLSYGQDAFSLSLVKGNAEVVRDLIAAGADVNRPHPDGDTPLHGAIARGQTDLAEILLAEGADPNRLNGRGWSPVLVAAMSRRKDLVLQLRAAGGRVDELTAVFLKPLEFEQAAGHPEFQAALKELGEAVGGPAWQIDWVPGAYYFRISPGPEAEERLRSGAAASRFWAEDVVLQDKVQSLLDRFQTRLLARGFFLWDIGRGIGCGPAGRFVGLAPTADKYAVIATMGTNGANYEIYSPDVVAWLKKMEEEDPCRLVGCGGDFLDVVFDRPVRDPDGLAKKMYEFCSDMVDQGVGSVDALVDHLKTRRRAHFWWD